MKMAQMQQSSSQQQDQLQQQQQQLQQVDLLYIMGYIKSMNFDWTL